MLTNWFSSSENCLVIAVFFTEWAGSVEILRGFITQIHASYPAVVVDWINIEQHQDLSANLEITGIPSVILIRNRKVVDHIAGIIPRRKLEERIQPHL